MKTERLVVLINGISGVLLLWISSTSLFQCFHPTETAIFGAALFLGSMLDKLRIDLSERE